MHSTRLPGKPLVDIAGEPMIVHVWRRAMAAEAGRVVVATDTEEIVAAVRKAGGEAVMTRARPCLRLRPRVRGRQPRRSGGRFRDHPQPAGRSAGHGARHRPRLPRPLQDKGPQIATIAAVITAADDRTNPNSVKVVGTPTGVPGRLRALYFTRATAPAGEGPLYHHFGMYAYRRSALERFVSLRPSTLEKREQLEQLRALEDGMRIDVTLVDSVPVEVNTPDDLERARRIISGKGRP